MKELSIDYTYEVDNINKDFWHKLLLEFDDASFYQTWSYGSILWGANNLSHIILKKNGRIVAIAQLRIVKLPLFTGGFAYLTSGPIWRKKNKSNDINVLRYMLRALYKEYVFKRRYLLRISPKQIHQNEESIRKVFENEKFSWSPDTQRTIYLDLTPPIEEIKKNLSKGWKKTLRRSMNKKLKFVEDDFGNFSDTSIKIIEEMKTRKGFIDFDSMRNNILINNDLPHDLKMKLILCEFENEVVAAFGWSTIGDIGIPLVSATGNKASKSLAAYRLFWKMIEFYKSLDLKTCDLAGINKKRNPGGYYFKKGLAGNTRIEKNYIGIFDSNLYNFSSLFFKIGMKSRQYLRNLIIKISRKRGV